MSSRIVFWNLVPSNCDPVSSLERYSYDMLCPVETGQFKVTCATNPLLHSTSVSPWQLHGEACLEALQGACGNDLGRVFICRMPILLALVGCSVTNSNLDSDQHGFAEQFFYI